MDEIREEVKTEDKALPLVEKIVKPKELERATLSISQGQWVVSHAEDPFYILETAHLGSCFAVIISEAKQRIGSMVHIDKEPDFDEIFSKMIALLDQNGGQSYRVIFVNCDFTGKSVIQRGETFQQTVKQKQEVLKEKGKLKKDFEYILGKEASFDLRTGDFCPFAISQKTFEAQIARQRELYASDVKPEILEYQLIYLSDKIKQKF